MVLPCYALKKCIGEVRKIPAIHCAVESLSFREQPWIADECVLSFPRSEARVHVNVNPDVCRGHLCQTTLLLPERRHGVPAAWVPAECPALGYAGQREFSDTEDFLEHLRALAAALPDTETRHLRVTSA